MLINIIQYYHIYCCTAKNYKQIHPEKFPEISEEIYKIGSFA